MKRSRVAPWLLALTAGCTTGAGQATDETGVPAAPATAATACTIVRVVDGDTIVCAPDVRVRLIGIDTPEMRDRPSGPQAKQVLAGRLTLGSVVSLEGDVDAHDRYGRTLAYVWVDGVMVNWWMMRNGWARLLTVPPNVRWVGALTAAQRAARLEQRGFWATGRFTCDTAARGDC